MGGLRRFLLGTGDWRTTGGYAIGSGASGPLSLTQILGALIRPSDASSIL